MQGWLLGRPCSFSVAILVADGPRRRLGAEHACQLPCRSRYRRGACSEFKYPMWRFDDKRIPETNKLEF